MKTALSRLSKVSVIPIPVNLGQPSLGLAKAPPALLDNGLVSMLGDIGWRWKQLPSVISDVNYGRDASMTMYETNELNAKNCQQVGKCCEVIMHSVTAECTPDNFPLILGGDHCIAIGTIPAIKAARPNTAVIWVDAHGDINTPATSQSGNMHGMPVAFLLGYVTITTTSSCFTPSSRCSRCFPLRLTLAV